MSACSHCGGSVVWKRVAGRWQCFNPDGTTIHWDSCSKRRWQQVKATGERFEGAQVGEEIASGYARSVHGTKLDRAAARPVTGQHYHPTGRCQDCVPPWEVCQECPDSFAAPQSVR